MKIVEKNFHLLEKNRNSSRKGDFKPQRDANPVEAKERPAEVEAVGAEVLVGKGKCIL